MPATEKIILQNRSQSVDKQVTDILTIGARRVDVSQFSPTGQEITTAGVTFNMKYTPTIAAQLANINGFTFAGEEYKRTDSSNDRKTFTITGERII